MKLNKVLALSVALSGVLAGGVATAQVLDDNSPGSFLVFPKFDIRGESATQIRIVNNGSSAIDVKINFVCPGVKHVNEFCAALDTTIPFTPHQTRAIDVADLNPPCNQGYVVAFPINSSGRAYSYNNLLGSYNITEGRRLESENAIAVQSPRSGGTVLGSNGKLRFGGEGADYSAMGSNLYTDFRAVVPGSEGEADVGSRLTLLTLDVLAGMQNPPAVAFIDFWNAAEVPYSSSIEFICWTEVQLDSIDLNFLEENLGTSHGSMKITPFPNCPLPGGCPPLTPYDATMLGHITEYGDGDRGGRSLYHDQEPKNTSYQPR